MILALYTFPNVARHFCVPSNLVLRILVVSPILFTPSVQCFVIWFEAMATLSLVWRGTLGPLPKISTVNETFLTPLRHHVTIFSTHAGDVWSLFPTLRPCVPPFMPLSTSAFILLNNSSMIWSVTDAYWDGRKLRGTDTETDRYGEGLTRWRTHTMTDHTIRKIDCKLIDSCNDVNNNEIF